MNLLNIATEEEWNAFSKDMHRRYGISFGVSDTAGARVSSYANWSNDVCPKIKSDPESLAAVCAVAAQHFTEKCRQSRGAEIGECDLGLIKIAVPIIVDGTFLGTAGGCGFATEKGDIETFLIQKLTAMDEGQVQELVKDIAPMTQDRAVEMAGDIGRGLDAIIERYLQR